jgi:hypothetical protein
VDFTTTVPHGVYLVPYDRCDVEKTFFLKNSMQGLGVKKVMPQVNGKRTLQIDRFH